MLVIQKPRTLSTNSAQRSISEPESRKAAAMNNSAASARKWNPRAIISQKPAENPYLRSSGLGEMVQRRRRQCMRGKILTGTASWTDPGFVQDWYPKNVPAAQRLRWYAAHFNLVEINSTFYRVPEARVVRKWRDETPDGFLFDVKLHRLLSRHSTKLELLPPELREKARVVKGRVEVTPELEKAVVKQFLKGIAPLEEKRKLGALLLQLSPAFSPRHHELKELDHLAKLLKGYQLAVELRNGGWVDEAHIAATKKYFKDRGITFVMVDGPDDPHFMVLPPVDVITTRELAYLRAHGRNASGYVRGRTVATRFDYDYPEDELHEIAERAVDASHQAKEVHVIYNNNKSDFAPRAALNTQEILHEEHPETLPAALEEREMAYA